MVLRALVTAGGTREPIDDVRVVTNLSRGAFGASIAKALADRGVEVTLLGSKELLRSPERLDPRLTLAPFDAFADLSTSLSRLAPGMDLVFMAAAVADYSPVREGAGKLSSSSDELVVRMTKNPKILSTLRDLCGIGATLVGFKLLSNVSPAELAEVARRQVVSARLDLTVANDLQQLGDARHPIVLVDAEGPVASFDAPRDEVAERLVDAVLRRRGAPAARVAAPPPPESPAARDARAALERAGLRVRAVAARGDAAEPLLQAALAARPDAPLAAVVAPDLALAPDALEPDLRAGSSDEVTALTDLLARAALAGRAPWLIELPPTAGEDRALLLLDRAGALLLATEAQVARAELEAARPGLELDGLGPLLDGRAAGPRLAGLTLARDVEPAGLALFVRPSRRGQGAGEAALAALDARGRPALAAADDVLTTGFAAARGFGPPRAVGQLLALAPPSRRTDLVAAASLLLVDVTGRRVLLGRRLRAPWLGRWSLPGGKLEPGEDALAAARRELAEETGLTLGPVRPWATLVAHVGSDARAFRITCLVLPALAPAEPRPTDELDAAWIPLDVAPTLSPMAPATRRALEALAQVVRRA